MTFIAQILAATIGTVAFSVLFSVPRKYYPYCGLIGGASWLVYGLFSEFTSIYAATLAATIVVVFLSRLTAVFKRCPVTIFLIPGVFPLVPGAHLYWTSYYIVTSDLSQALEHGYMAVKMAVAIVLGIVLVFELPQKMFVVLTGKKPDRKLPEQ